MVHFFSSTTTVSFININIISTYHCNIELLHLQTSYVQTTYLQSTSFPKCTTPI